MISFTIALSALILGYILYGKFVERVFQPDNRPTPAVAKADGADYIVMPTWKVFMIQFYPIFALPLPLPDHCLRVVLVVVSQGV